MNSSRSSRRTEAFTLVELLCVIAIIGILASLIMAAANQAQSQARRIGCVSRLQQMGIAFQLFLHDHDDNFPMTIPAAAGGSLEFVENGYAVGGEFYFSYHHFQTISNELGQPKMLICPTDPRLPAASFPALQNSNVSYFIGVKAAYARPESILAGDRNLTANVSTNPSILYGSPDNRLWWTGELHQFKGNVLLADGHVEEWNNAALAAAGDQLAGADLFMPTIPNVSGAAAISPAGSRNHPDAGPAAETPPAPATLPPPPAGVANNFMDTRTRPGPDVVSLPGISSPTNLIRTNATTVIAADAPGPGKLTRETIGTKGPTFDQRLTRILQAALIGIYLLTLLLLLLWLLLALGYRSQQKRTQRETGP